MPANLPVTPILETPRLRLRPLVAEDAAAMHVMYGDPDTVRFWDMLPSKDLSATAARVNDSIAASPEWHATWAVLLKADGKMIGAVNYHARILQHRRLAVGWILQRPFRNQGFMREAVTPMLDYCFESLGTHRIEARIEPENAPSQHLAERLGFRWEGGVMRDWLLVGDTWRDMRMYALLEDDWRARAKG